MKSTPSEDAVMIIEMTKNDLECYINLVDKTRWDLRGLTLIFKDILWYQTALNATKKLFMKEKNQLMWQSSLLSCFTKSPQSPQPSATTILTTQQP